MTAACAPLQRLGRENAALLERAGIDDLGDLTTKDLNLQTMQQQLSDSAGSTAAAAVATPDVPSTEIAVEALSVQDQQQQQPQQEAEEEEEEELPEDLQDFAEILEGVVDWGNQQEKMVAALNKLGTWRPCLNPVIVNRSFVLCLVGCMVCAGACPAWRTTCSPSPNVPGLLIPPGSPAFHNFLCCVLQA